VRVRADAACLRGARRVPAVRVWGASTTHTSPHTHTLPPLTINRSINDTDVMFEGEDKENQEFFDFDDVANI